MVEILAVIFLFASVIISIMKIFWRKFANRLLLLRKLYTSFSGAAGNLRNKSWKPEARDKIC